MRKIILPFILFNFSLDFQKQGTFLTKTGFFGVWLHFGLIELKKLN